MNEPASTKVKRSREEILEELDAAFQKQHALAGQLLNNIKTHRETIERVLARFRKEEPDLVYRFYHQSFKVFIMTSLIGSADELFKSLSPDSRELDPWYIQITSTALSRKFEDSETNENWFEVTTPVLLAFWNSKYILERMLAAADELTEPPTILPSGWAAVLCLYGLR